MHPEQQPITGAEYRSGDATPVAALAQFYAAFNARPRAHGHIGRERGTLERDGEQLALAIRTARVFRREGGTWRQVHHHGSMDAPTLLQRYQDLVRAR